MSFVGVVAKRAYADFLMPSRLHEYRALLTEFLSNGYRTTTLREFARLAKAKAADAGQRLLVLRQDVDTDLATSRAMWQIERELGVNATRYFRLSTIDVPFMQDIEKEGGEASYHFEEIATFAKRHGLTSRRQVLERLPEVKNMFRDNITRLRAMTGLPMQTVASHGDFVNRKLDLCNWEITKDREL
ncbi:MAG: hypothetical protein MI725_06505, partial [Pirellulales bacterium]|nr:hypothetical protein [Pirellulales bacterium]